MMRPWLSRLAFSFLIIGTFLAWEGYQAATGRLGNISHGRIILYLVGAMFSMVLFALGVRERHKKD